MYSADITHNNDSDHNDDVPDYTINFKFEDEPQDQETETTELDTEQIPSSDFLEY